jgi:hypothetical protein
MSLWCGEIGTLYLVALLTRPLGTLQSTFFSVAALPQRFSQLRSRTVGIAPQHLHRLVIRHVRYCDHGPLPVGGDLG